MKCADPTLCYNNAENKRIFRSFSYYLKNKTFLPSNHVIFDCGKCLHCRKKKAYELASRCVLHASLYKENCFLTLTYDEKKPSYHNNFEYTDIQKFKKRLRKHAKKKIDIFNVHEYGKNGKKHWHLVVFNYRPEDCVLHTIANGIPLYTSRELEKRWPHGFNTVGDVSTASAMYQAQYMEKDFKNSHDGTLKKSHSKHSGIGKPYFELHYRQILQLAYVPIDGGRLPVPRYFEKLAHKHYCHFFDRSFFYDSKFAKRRYSPFHTDTDANREIAELWPLYKKIKEEKILDLETEWNDTVSKFLTTSETPDFIKSNQNALYDLRNKQQKEKF